MQNYNTNAYAFLEDSEQLAPGSMFASLKNLLGFNQGTKLEKVLENTDLPYDQMVA